MWMILVQLAAPATRWPRLFLNRRMVGVQLAALATRRSRLFLMRLTHVIWVRLAALATRWSRVLLAHVMLEPLCHLSLLHV